MLKSKNFKKTLFILLGLFSIQSFSQNYEGTIGPYPIYFQLDPSFSDQFRASYFYKSQLKNIKLEGDSSGNEILLWEKYSSMSSSNEIFELQIQGPNLIGKWKSKNNTFDVKLFPSQLDFDKLKEEQIQYLRDSIQKFATKEIVWFSEKYSKTSLFRLGNGFSKKQREFINPQLDSLQKFISLVYLECDYLSSDMEIKLISDEYLCFMHTYSVFCGGAHLGHSLETFNFNLKNLSRINSLEEIYPNNKFLELLKIKYQDNEEYEKECDYFSDLKSDHWIYMNWVLSEKGIYLIPSFPHAMTPGREPFLLLYQEIEN